MNTKNRKLLHSELGYLFHFRYKMYKNLHIHQRINVKSNFGIGKTYGISRTEMPHIKIIFPN